MLVLTVMCSDPCASSRAVAEPAASGLGLMGDRGLARANNRCRPVAQQAQLAGSAYPLVLED